MKTLPDMYALDYRVFGLAKETGQSEEYIREHYTFTEIFERGMFNSYDAYVQRKLMESK